MAYETPRTEWSLSLPDHLVVGVHMYDGKRSLNRVRSSDNTSKSCHSFLYSCSIYTKHWVPHSGPLDLMTQCFQTFSHHPNCGELVLIVATRLSSSSSIIWLHVLLTTILYSCILCWSVCVEVTSSLEMQGTGRSISTSCRRCCSETVSLRRPISPSTTTDGAFPSSISALTRLYRLERQVYLIC